MTLPKRPLPRLAALAAAFAVAGLAAALPAPALAKPGDAECVWNRMPPAFTGELMTRMKAAQTEGVAFDREKSAADYNALLARFAPELAEASRACGLAEPLSKALMTGQSLKAYGAADLTAAGISPKAVDERLAALPAADRGRLLALMINAVRPGGAQPSEEDRRFLFATMTVLLGPEWDRKPAGLLACMTYVFASQTLAVLET